MASVHVTIANWGCVHVDLMLTFVPKSLEIFVFSILMSHVKKSAVVSFK